MRHSSTLAEKHTWHILRDRRTLGLKFRRQVPIDDFIVDFYCDELKLVIELDGDVHDRPRQKERDEGKDRKLMKLGYQILRFRNDLAINNPDALLEIVRSLRPSPGAARRPLPGGEV